MVDAVLLDWEGVLADTCVARGEAMLHALAREGVATDQQSIDAECAGRTTHAAAAALVARAGIADPTLVDLVTLRATSGFAERLGKGLVLIRGAREFVERAQLDASVAIVTSATRGETAFVLGLAGLDGAVSTIVSADDALEPPPHRAMYDHAVENIRRRRGVQRARTVALVPTVAALRAARGAGLRAVAVDLPAHAALDADGAIATVLGLTLRDLSALSGVSMLERHR
ncbi:MAG: HAD hydrolase-like protein [bacterium]